MQQQDQINAIADHYGWTHQRDKVIEELAELMRAIAIRDAENIEEEIADVEIMLAQIKHLLDCEKQVEEVKHYKINRQLSRIAEESNA